MTKKDLINLKDRTPEERRRIATKGGLVKSETKRVANLTKNLKHGKYATQLSLTVNQLAKSPETSALKIFDLIERIGDDWDKLNHRLKMDLARLYCEAHKTIHGTKQLNVNLNTELKQDLERWFSNEENKS